MKAKNKNSTRRLNEFNLNFCLKFSQYFLANGIFTLYNPISSILIKIQNENFKILLALSQSSKVKLNVGLNFSSLFNI
jgi:hypothetical protein